MPEKLDVVAAGHICLDIAPSFDAGKKCRVEDIFSPGKLTNVGGAGLSTGGAVSNTGIALLLMGFKTVLSARVGGDFFGKAVLDILKEYGAHSSMSVAAKDETSYSIVLSPPGIDRMFLHNPGANGAFGHADIDYGKVGSARVFHLGYPPLLKRMYVRGGSELKKVLEEAKTRGATTSVDMSLPDPESGSGKADWAGILRKTLPFTDIFMPSAEELFFMLRRDEFMRRRSGLRGRPLLDCITPEEISSMGSELISCGAGVVLIKCGERGIYMRTAGRARIEGFGRLAPLNAGDWPERELWAPPFKARRFASALGAGDNAAAGFLGAMLKGGAPGFSLLAAAACGAMNVEYPDALSGIRPWDEIKTAVEKGWKQQRISPGRGWTFSSRLSLFKGPEDS